MRSGLKWMTMISRDAAGIACVALLAAACTHPETRPPAVRFATPIGEGRILSTFTLSRNGQWLAYSAEAGGDHKRRIFIRSLRSAGEVDRELPGTIGGTTPFFSPDSTSIAFFAKGGVWRVAADGRTAPRRLGDAPVDSAGGTWTDDGRIVFAPLGNAGLRQIPAEGALEPEVLTSLDKQELAHGWPHALPGNALAFAVAERGRDPHVEILSPDNQRHRLRIPVAGQVQFVETGHLIYGYLGNLMAVRFDPAKFEMQGVPTAVAKNLQMVAGFGTLGRTGFAVSQTGTLVWTRASSDDAKSRLVRVSRDGSYVVLSNQADAYQTPRISPDGRRVAVVVRPGVMTREIRVLDYAKPAQVLLAIRGGDNQSPAWMDNRRLSYASNRDGPQKIYLVNRGGRSAPMFTADVAAARNPASWSRAGQLLALYEVDPIRRRDVLIYRVGESITPAAATNANERSPVVSPDGRWIAYVSDVSGRDEIYVKSLDGAAEASQLTTAGAVEPVWTREGLFYREGDRMLLAASPSGAAGERREVFEGHFERDPGANAASYDVDNRGNFIMLKSALVPRELRVVQNWATELASR
jgi:eukaryotic-like serine/threonine-protein kinase